MHTLGKAISGKSIAITGGAGGIGQEVAQVLARGGARVAIGDLDEKAANTAANAIPGVTGVGVDVTDPESMEHFLDEAQAAHGPVDILILAAGIMWVGPFDAEGASTAAAQVNVNLLGVIQGVKAGSARMVERGGHIMTIASVASLLGPPGEATYAATKHGVLGYLKTVREELRGSNIHLSAIMPAVVDTELAAGTDAGAAKMLTTTDVAQAVVRTIAVPKFEVTVPGFIGPLNRVVGLLPTPVRDAVYRLMVPNQVKKSDSTARAGYESRFNS